MLFLKDKGDHCLKEYIKDQTTCGSRHSDLKSKSYGFCVDDATADLEACALMDLIETHKFEKFHVDVTAWMTFKGVVIRRAEAESLYKASRETLKKVSNPKDKRPSQDKIAQWKHYVKTFKVLDESVNHELEIAIWREAIELDASKDASARNELDKLAVALAKHKKEKEAKKKLWDLAIARYNAASKKLRISKETVAKLLKQKKSIELKITELEETHSKSMKSLESSEIDLTQYENELERLIKSRERQPVGDLKKGWECFLWYSFQHGVQKPNVPQQWAKYEAFDFSKKPDKEFTLSELNFAHRSQMEGAIRNAMNDKSFRGEYFLMRVEGVFVAPADDTYTFQTNSDDGSYLYLGQLPLTHGKAIVQNGGHHGMRTKKGSLPMKKGQEQQFVITFWQHYGGLGLKFDILNGKNQKVAVPQHFESSQQKWW